MFVIQLGEEPNPFDPEEHLHCFVGPGARVLHIALARVYKERWEATRAAAKFPLSEVLDLRGKQVLRLDSLPLYVFPTLESGDAYAAMTPAQQKAEQKKWIAALSLPDDRCPAGGTVLWMIQQQQPKKGPA